jgi:hypothetical protein
VNAKANTKYFSGKALAVVVVRDGVAVVVAISLSPFSVGGPGSPYLRPST